MVRRRACVHELAVLLAGQTAAQTDHLAPWMNACISSSVTRLRSEHEPVSTGLAQESRPSNLRLLILLIVGLVGWWILRAPFAERKLATPSAFTIRGTAVRLVA